MPIWNTSIILCTVDVVWNRMINSGPLANKIILGIIKKNSLHSNFKLHFWVQYTYMTLAKKIRYLKVSTFISFFYFSQEKKIRKKFVFRVFVTCCILMQKITSKLRKSHSRGRIFPRPKNKHLSTNYIIHIFV